MSIEQYAMQFEEKKMKTFEVNDNTGLSLSC